MSQLTDQARINDDFEAPDIGPCCVCGKDNETVRNIHMLSFRAPSAGTGWGCLICNLPLDGAVAVVCDDCQEEMLEDSLEEGESKIEYKWLIYGKPDLKMRILFENVVQIPFDHDLSKHEEGNTGLELM